jgi:hypothetical protein
MASVPAPKPAGSPDTSTKSVPVPKDGEAFGGCGKGR